MSTNPEAVGEDLVADLATLRRDVGRLADAMSEMAHDRTREAGLRIAQTVDGARDKIASTAARGRDGVRAARGEIEAQIEHNPLRAVLISFVAGAALGLILRPRG